jgi:hypothetical protein
MRTSQCQSCRTRARVAHGTLPAFHVVFHGLRADGVEIPSIGAFFVEDELALDYRMGGHWTPSSVAAFATLINELRSVAGSHRVVTRADGASQEHEDASIQMVLDTFSMWHAT